MCIVDVQFSNGYYCNVKLTQFSLSQTMFILFSVLIMFKRLGMLKDRYQLIAEK